MKKITIVFIAGLFLGSCQDAYVLEEKTTRTDYFDLFDMFNQDNDGYFNIQYSTVANGQYSPYDVAKIDGNIDDGNSLLNLGEIKFNEIAVNPDEHNEYQLKPNTECVGLYGKEVNVKIKGQSTSFYLSEPIKFINWEINDEVYPGYTVEWNKDEKNKIGVAIRLLYSSNGDNYQYKEQGFSENKANYIFLNEDNGSYTLKESDFDGIPNGAIVSLGMARGGATIMNLDNQKIRLAGISYNIIPHIKVRSN
jgi:hypothetical protein